MLTQIFQKQENSGGDSINLSNLLCMLEMLGKKSEQDR